MPRKLKPLPEAVTEYRGIHLGPYPITIEGAELPDDGILDPVAVGRLQNPGKLGVPRVTGREWVAALIDMKMQGMTEQEISLVLGGSRRRVSRAAVRFKVPAPPRKFRQNGEIALNIHLRRVEKARRLAKGKPAFEVFKDEMSEWWNTIDVRGKVF